MGEVYKAFHPTLERDVAIKLIRTQQAYEPNTIDRFRREAKVVAALRHPGIVQVHDFDVEGNTFFMVMEYIPGESLHQRLALFHARDERMPVDEALRLFRLMTEAVAYAHGQGVIHRDLKPANVLLTSEDKPILVDFGLSKMLSGEELAAFSMIMGTPQYMSPEQGSGASFDASTDVYALGVMLYEMTTGTLPFSADTPVGVILKHLNEPPTPPRSINPSVPEPVEQIIQKALAKDRNERFASAQELLSAIDSLMLPLPGDTFGATVLSAIDDGRCPYRGLQTFEAEHAEFFYGREALIYQLVEQVVNLSLNGGKEGVGRFLVILGASGSGKSSLVRAGLIPTLQKEGTLLGADQWIIRVMKPGNRPLEELVAQLTPILYEPVELLKSSRQLLDNLTADGRTLQIALRLAWADAPPQQRLLLIVDQFEEVFTLCQDETERQRFHENLLYAAGSDGRAIVLLTMRADFYHRCAAYRDLASRISAQQALVGPMNEAELRRAIQRPAQQVGLRFEPGLVDTILTDVAEQPGALPLLQHTLLELWERRQRGVLTLEAYRASGGVAGSIAQRAETVYTDFNHEEKVIVRRLMLRLTQPGEGTEDTRRRVNKRELLPDNEQAEVVENVIQQLADARLVTTTRDLVSGEEQVDVAHEALIRGWERLRGWLDEDRAGLLIHRRLTEAAEAWSKSDCDPSYLYRGIRLTEVREWAPEHQAELNVLEREFLSMSALYEIVPEEISWAEVLASKHLLDLFVQALKSNTLFVRGQREAIASLSHWARNQDTEQQHQVITLLGEIASDNNDFDTRLLAVENMWLLNGTEAVYDWWTRKHQDKKAAETKLLAHLWDGGIKILPVSNRVKARTFGELLQLRWQQRKKYILRWIVFGTLGSTLISLVLSVFLGDTGLAANIAGVILVSTLSGLGLSFGLSWGELFEGWPRIIVRNLSSIAIVFLSFALANLVLGVAYQVPVVVSTDVLISVLAFTLAAGLGMSIGEFLPRHASIGHIVFGCVAVLSTHYLIRGSIGSTVIALGVVIGTGIARLGRKTG
jgi:tRNA A-37 threonylcarbamoyl transferase component Bud32